MTLFDLGPDPVLSLGATLIGIAILLPLVWLPSWLTLWAMSFGMLGTAGLYAVAAQRRRVTFSRLEKTLIVVMWPVALGVVIIMKGRKKLPFLLAAGHDLRDRLMVPRRR